MHDKIIPLEGTFRERMIDKAHRFIKNHVPTHTQHEYEMLLAVNTDLALQLISKWQELEDLREHYYQLQKEAVQGIPVPPVRVDSCVSYNPAKMTQVTSARWQIETHLMNFSLFPEPFHRMRGGERHQLDEMVRAFHACFHKEYVPKLWEQTAASLQFSTAAAQQQGYGR
jgi:hypothetical protein